MSIDLEIMIITCGTCGKETDTCYTDGGTLGMVHGQCQCRECYAKNGHPYCPNCGDLTDKLWRYCSHCGTLLLLTTTSTTIPIPIKTTTNDM